MFQKSSIAIVAATVAGMGAIAISGAQAQDEPMLTGTVWELQRIQYNNDTEAVPMDPSRYTIEFFEDGNVGVIADCNVVRGTFDPDSTEFITLGASTLAACPPNSIDNEYKQALENAAIYFFEDGNLYMDLFADAGTMMFAPADETAAVEEETETMVEEETEVMVEEETEVMEESTETTTESEPVRGLW